MGFRMEGRRVIVKEMEKQAWGCENSKGIEASGRAASLAGCPGHTRLCTTLANGAWSPAKGNHFHGSVEQAHELGWESTPTGWGPSWFIVLV